jgi:hypothetical protein
MSRPGVVAHLRFALQCHGWLLVAGLLFLLVAVALQYLGVDVASAQVAQLRSETAALRQQAARKPDPAETAARQNAAFYAALPTTAGGLESVALIHHSASENQVQISTADYRMLPQGNTQLLRYQITLPARASYVALRAWMADVLNQMPGAVLEELTFKREEAESDEVQALLRLTLIMRAR